MNAPIENHMVIGNAEHGALLTAAEEQQREADIAERVAEKLTDAKWWDGQLEGVNFTTRALPRELARMMDNAQRARDGEGIAMQAILSALYLIERAAKADAEPQAEDEVDA